MDYFTLPRNPTHDLIEVPFLCTENYDGGEFFTYPLRQGWRPRSAWDWQRVFNDRSGEISRFFQTWLLFGTMEAVFEWPISVFEFKCQSEILTMVPLRRHLHYYFRNGNSRKSIPEFTRTMEVLGYTSTISVLLQEPSQKNSIDGSREIDILQFLKSIHFTKSIDPRIVLSTTLTDFILYKAFTTKDIPGRSSADRSSLQMNFAPFMGLISLRMRKDGWCPSELLRMHNLLNYSAMYFMSHIERPDTSRTHHLSSPSLPDTSQMNQNRYWSGEVCNQHKCAMYHFDDTTYQTKHADGCTGCREMVADYEEIDKILKKGSIPLILSIDAEDDSQEITLVESESDVKYVAISHVWSDGLGNVQRSALPRCQMLRLSNLIRTLPGKASDLVLFWIDTIGCPPDAAEKGEAQTLAISMMRQTYENACAVLVLESWIQATNIGQMTDLERVLRILSSGWNSRLWTLQEGALAQNLFFQFADMAYDLEGGFESLNSLDDSILEYSLLRDNIMQRMQDLRSFKNRDTTILHKITAAVFALAFRSTSVATDEALCLATLLDMDVMKVYQEPTKKRMIHIWRSFDSVPVKFLFLPHPKLQTPGFRWAPSTLLRGPRTKTQFLTYPAEHDSVARRTEEGLQFQREGWVIWTGKHPLPKDFTARLEDGKLHHYHRDFSDNARAHQETDGDETTGSLKLNVFKHYHTEELAFLAATSIQGNIFSEGRDTAGLTRGLLVAVTKKVDDVIYGRVVCGCWREAVFPEDNAEFLAHLRARLPPHVHYDSGDVVDNDLNEVVCALSEYKKESQYWCVE